MVSLLKSAPAGVELTSLHVRTFAMLSQPRRIIMLAPVIIASTCSVCWALAGGRIQEPGLVRTSTNRLTPPSYSAVQVIVRASLLYMLICDSAHSSFNPAELTPRALQGINPFRNLSITGVRSFIFIA